MKALLLGSHMAHPDNVWEALACCAPLPRVVLPAGLLLADGHTENSEWACHAVHHVPVQCLHPFSVSTSVLLMK